MGINVIQLTVAVITCDGEAFQLKRLICTVGTELSQRRVETTFSSHKSRVTVFTVEETDVVLLVLKPFKRADVDSEKLCVLETAISKFGKAPSIIVHNAGWSYPNKSGLEVAMEQFDWLFSVKVRSVYVASKVLIPEMKKNGHSSTVVISSVSSATKVNGLRIARDQLRFNTICPTSGNTPLLNKFAGIADGPVPTEIIKAKCESIPIGRLVGPSDVANVALFLAELASSIISEVEILVDGARCV
ncbi:hypothetical protein N7463_002029 [Penicillium fimorum]|uniref:Uncharacterized protein n=1 Tax=Penicillium fimorum TaxID=1882269 RepID=A0A9X0C821_9EURO|nr:hypothetical protein N7463_002029 [Penicillium fimorum]